MKQQANNTITPLLDARTKEEDDTTTDHLTPTRASSRILQQIRSQGLRAPAVPSRGARCRVLNRQDDVFGRSQESWYLATIQKVARGNKSSTYKLAVRYDDNGTEEDLAYPSDIVQLIIAGPTNQHFLYSEKGEFVGDTCPKTLQIGDLVFGRFQNGVENGAWYRGRVADHPKIQNGICVCDIVYDDKDYEVNVPTTQTGNIIWIEGGHDNPQWLVGLTAPIPSEKLKNIKSGKIIYAKKKGTVRIEYTDRRSKQKVAEEKSYQSVVKAIFKALKNRRDVRVIHWPRDFYEVVAEITSPKPKGTSSKKGTTSATESLKSPPPLNNSNDQKQPPNYNNNKAALEVDMEEESDDDDDDEKGAKHPNEEPTRDMLPALATSLEKALNSSDCHVGVNLLHGMLNLQRTPNASLCKALIDLMTFGPESNGTRFPDANRMEYAEGYIDRVLKIPNLLDKFVKAAGNSYWEACLDQMFHQYYMADGDDSRITVEALERIGLTVHAKVRCARLFARLLEHVTSRRYDGSENDMLARPIIRDICNHRRSFKEGIDKAVKAAVFLRSSLMVFETDHYSKMCSNEGVTNTLLLQTCFIQKETTELLKSMGIIVGNLAYLYGLYTHENAASLAYLIRNILENQIQNSICDANPILSRENHEYWQKVKFMFILDLNTKIKNLRPQLADLLGCADKWNLLYGNI